ncbi:ABC transporter ATP-binding protein [Massilia sp. LC238]|uniref:ABC transporter ATP-binding protein n=1 Tax=Massilia sp. LC238 TaxID=1502852 RepID=UPI0004E35217|nr:ABC transporter ATP-binding protein [Massilia sp. LC238]KFC73757.1 ABC transport system ATP-bindig protein [Massilia sp. LC238]
MARLEFDRVTVQYPVYDVRAKSLRRHLMRVSTGGRIEAEGSGIQLVTALRDASFRLRDGDSVGLLGHNGAGKSTLLRTMAGVYCPSSGSVLREGQVATVFELGAGMESELSGYENIRRMAMLLGIGKREIAARLPDIEEFTQLGSFLHLPVRTYSAGMATRLMFAVATSTSPDILLVDEIFGAGDAEFQLKAATRMEALISSVRIFVFASHDIAALKRHCRRFFRLEHGLLCEVDANLL